MNSENSDSVFHKILRSIDSGDNVISNTCLEVVLDLMKCMSQNALYSEVIPYAVGKTHTSKPVNERVVGCFLLGGAVINMDLALVKRDVLPVVQSLCQDDIADVRAAICTQFPIIYSAIAPEENSHLLILPFLIELANDIDDKVCAEAWDAILNMVSSLSDDVTETFILPMLKSFFKKCVNNTNELLLTVCSGTGKMFSLLEERISLEDKKWFLSFYMYLSRTSTALSTIVGDLQQTKQICQLSSEVTEYCKLQCSSNFLTIAKCCTTGKDAEIAGLLYSLLCSLCSCDDNLIKTTMATDFYAITEIFFEFEVTVVNLFLYLLSDTDDGVCDSCIPHITSVLSLNADKGTFRNNEQLTVEAVKCINIVIERKALKNNWRAIVSLMGHQQNLLRMITHTNLLRTYTVNPLFKFLKNLRQLPCRIAVGTTLFILMKEDHNQNHRNEIQNRIVQELCCSNSFYDRTIYVQLCLKMLEIFPDPSVRKQFLHHLLHLSGDPIVNIRISVCIIVPKLACILINEKDNESMIILQEIIETLEKQPNKCVVEQVKFMHKSMYDISTKTAAPIEHDKPDTDKNMAVEEDTNANLNANSDTNLLSGVFNNLLNKCCKNEESQDINKQPWSEKEFLMDTGVHMKSTTVNSKIPAPNRKLVYLKNNSPFKLNLQLFDVKSKPPDKIVPHRDIVTRPPRCNKTLSKFRSSKLTSVDEKFNNVSRSLNAEATSKCLTRVYEINDKPKTIVQDDNCIDSTCVNKATEANRHSVESNDEGVDATLSEISTEILPESRSFGTNSSLRKVNKGSVIATDFKLKNVDIKERPHRQMKRFDKHNKASSLNDRVNDLSISDKQIDNLSVKSKTESNETACMIPRITNDGNQRLPASVLINKMRKNSSLQRNTPNRRSLPSHCIPRTVQGKPSSVRYFDDSYDIANYPKKDDINSKIFTSRKDIRIKKITNYVGHTLTQTRCDEKSNNNNNNNNDNNSDGKSNSIDALKFENIGTKPISRLPVRHIPK